MTPSWRRIALVWSIALIGLAGLGWLGLDQAERNGIFCARWSGPQERGAPVRCIEAALVSRR